jgi:cytochrome c oxidase subunit 4
MSHNPPARNYTLVLVGLLILTVITVGLSKVDMGRPGNIVVGLLVAVIKASLVVMFFMHLKYEHRWWAVFVLFPLVLVSIIIFSNFADTGYGDFTTPPKIGVPEKSAAH